jgi:indole-3-glycerol phosphate synthase
VRAGILQAIVARRRERLAAAPATDLPERQRWEPFEAAENPFLAALVARRRQAGGAVVAEVKMGSPRLASLAGRIDPLELARVYARQGAAALSVVVEPDFFGGSGELLADCRRASGLPAIAKDFVVDARQLGWAAEAGAAAVLLIASLLPSETLGRFAALARGLGMVPLIEVHDAADVAKLTATDARGTRLAGWELVGVNNRDLTTFEVDLAHSLALRSTLPPSALTVAESGIRDGADVARLARGGFDAVLVGESLLLAPDPGAKLAELVAAFAPCGEHAQR